MIEVTGDTESKNSCRWSNEKLQLKIETGNERYAGTDDNINLLLRSANGVICRVYNLDNWGDDHERNSIDKYNICCPKGFSSDGRELSMLALAHMTSGRGNGYPGTDDWFIERIELRAGGRVLFDYRFHDWTSPMTQWMFGVTKIGNNTNYTRF